MHGIVGAGIAFSLPIQTDDPNLTDAMEPDPKDFTMTLRYSLAGRSEIALSMYTLTTYALNVSYLLTRESANTPAFFVGIDDISYNTHVSTIGTEEETGFIEEKNYHLRNGGRPPELLSAYCAMQKSMGLFTVVIGLGRGRFVGYGPRSHIFNTDLFVLGEDYVTEDHSSWAFGAFFGGSLRFPFGLELIAEIDGRDGNAGVKYHHKYFTTTLALTKVEHFWSPRPYSPRFTIGLESSNRFMLERREFGSLECTMQDMTSKELLLNATVHIKELNTRHKVTDGTFSISLPTGSYTFTISKSDYVDYVAKISFRPGVKNTVVFDLQKTDQALKREAALRENEEKIRNYVEQGKIYYAEDNLDEARASFEMVIALEPRHEEARDYLELVEVKRAELISRYTDSARSSAEAENWERALEYWQKVLDLDATHTEAKAEIDQLRKKLTPPKKPPTTKPSPPKKVIDKEQIAELYQKGVSYFTAEKYDEALKMFRQILALDPNHTGALDYKKRTEARIRVLKGGG
jgi:tetratricopeptide (TPR) repeat protein